MNVYYRNVLKRAEIATILEMLELGKIFLSHKNTLNTLANQKEGILKN